MSEVTTDKDINLGQLSDELGRKALRCRFGDENRVQSDEVTQNELEAAIEAHDADPDWVDPVPPPEESLRPERVRTKIEQGIVRLETDAKDQATWDALTPERRGQDARIACLMVAKLARLVLNKFDVEEV